MTKPKDYSLAADLSKASATFTAEAWVLYEKGYNSGDSYISKGRDCIDMAVLASALAEEGKESTTVNKKAKQLIEEASSLRLPHTQSVRLVRRNEDGTWP